MRLRNTIISRTYKIVIVAKRTRFIVNKSNAQENRNRQHHIVYDVSHQQR